MNHNKDLPNLTTDNNSDSIQSSNEFGVWRTVVTTPSRSRPAIHPNTNISTVQQLGPQFPGPSMPQPPSILPSINPSSPSLLQARMTPTLPPVNPSSSGSQLIRRASMGSFPAYGNSSTGMEPPPSPRLFSSGDSGVVFSAAEISKIEKRKLKNRESAARSQEKRKREVAELQGQVNTLKIDNTTLETKNNNLQQDYTVLDSEFRQLKIRYAGMEEQMNLLQALNHQYVRQINKLTADLNRYREAERINTQQQSLSTSTSAAETP